MVSADMAVHYQGPALDNTRMRVEDLAPSLLALADVLKRIQKIYNPEETPISLEIKATETGSFIVDWAISTQHELIGILSGKTASAGANLLAYLTSFGALVGLIVKVAKSKIKGHQSLKDGEVQLTFEDGTKLTIPEEALTAYKDVEIRRSVSKVVEPARKNGIDAVSFAAKTFVDVTVTKQEVAAFDPPAAPQETFAPIISTEYLQLVTVSSQAGGKWKFSDGNTQFFASIEDEEFVQSVATNMDQFGATDSLKVRMRKTQTMTDTGLKSDVVIEKVLAHILGAKQLELDLGENQDDPK